MLIKNGAIIQQLFKGIFIHSLKRICNRRYRAGKFVLDRILRFFKNLASNVSIACWRVGGSDICCGSGRLFCARVVLIRKKARDQSKDDDNKSDYFLPATHLVHACIIAFLSAMYIATYPHTL